MSDCVVCDGSGFVKAAPISLPAERPAGFLPPSPKFYRKPLWASAVIAPCFACGAALVGIAR